MRAVDVGGRMVGPGYPCFVIAEAGVNHNGDVELAKRLVDVAVRAGADAVKFQTFRAERLVSPGAPKAAYQSRTTDAGESQHEMLQRLELSSAAYRELLEYCTCQGVMFMSTPFDEISADLLADLGLAVFKMASGEITNLPFIAHVARKHIPMIISTGGACLGEVETAVYTIERAGNQSCILLHCVSNYPANPADVNLRAMHTMAAAFGLPVGYSDHTRGLEVPIASAALGACVIEKHVTLDRTLPGPDHQASLQPDEFESMVAGIRTVEAALGNGRKAPSSSEAETVACARRSLVAACDIPVGAVLTEDMIAIKRPGTGLPPDMRPLLVGCTVRTSIPAGALFSLEMLG